MSLELEKIIMKILTSVALSLICFLIINHFIVSVNIFEYLIIEVLLVLSHTFYKFVYRWISVQQR
jgi:hypothetical protein